MKKIVLLISLGILLTGCSTEEKISESSSEISGTVTENDEAATTSTIISTTTAETVTETVTETTEAAQPVFTEISENIRVYDLYLPENSELKPEEKIIYSHEMEMSDYGVISNADGKISLIANDGTEKLLTESPYPDDAYKWVRTDFAIDDSRFAYSVCNEWGNSGFGVYDLDKMEDRQIMSPEAFGYFPKAVCGKSLILAKRGYFDFCGFAKCDLETFGITDIDLPIDYENMSIIWNDVSENGLGAVLSMEDIDDKQQSTEYTVTVMSLDKCEIIGEFTFETEGKYSAEMEFVSENELYLYAKRHENGVYNSYNLYDFRF